MLKFLGFILLAVLIIVMFNTPARNFMNNLLHKDKAELREEQIIGTVSGHNSRVEEIQQILKDAELEPGPVDGVMGAQTRSAIRKFQKEKGLKQTGKIDSVTYLALNRKKEVAKEPSKTELEKDSFVSVSGQNQEINVIAEEKKSRADVQDEIMSYRLKPKGRIRQIQTALRKAGFYKGEIDGKEGPQTTRAIKAFQKAKGLNPDGVVGSKTWEELEKYLKAR
jgi:peptidoglycan hydrolase-like protein with peptidoglycan-binding domain